MTDEQDKQDEDGMGLSGEIRREEEYGEKALREQQEREERERERERQERLRREAQRDD